MAPDLIVKLTQAVQEPIATEMQIVYIMVEIRKLMDQGKARSRYPVHRMFCDWTVHVGLTTAEAIPDLIRNFEEALERERVGKGFSWEFIDFLSLSHFRQELLLFLKDNELPMDWVKTDDKWNKFIDLYSGVVSDCPINYTRKDFRSDVIESLTLTKDELDEESHSFVRSLLSPDPHRVWMNWRVQLRNGDVKYWPYYT